MAISIVRTIILFLLIIVCMRIMGKRQFGELEPSELVVAVMISDIAANPLQDTGIPLLYGIIPVLTLLCCEIFISFAVVKSIKFRGLVCGKPSIIIDGGKIDQKEMRKNRFTLDELIVELRKQNISDISTVKHAILETDGSLSIMLYAGESPVTPNQMSLSVEDNCVPIILINGGRLMEQNLTLIQKDEKWLKKELKKRGFSSAADVYMFTVDSKNKIYCERMRT